MGRYGGEEFLVVARGIQLAQGAQLAERLRALRTEDVMGRYGGEEFLVVARNIHLAQGAQLAERLRALLTSAPIVFEGTPLAVSASFGVASLACCGAERDTRALLGLADARLYEAKRAGRNRVVARDEAAG